MVFVMEMCEESLGSVHLSCVCICKMIYLFIYLFYKNVNGFSIQNEETELKHTHYFGMVLQNASDDLHHAGV